MSKLLIWGAAGQAKVVADAARRGGQWQIAGFIDDIDPSRRGEAFAGGTVLGGREALRACRVHGVEAIFLAFGHNAARLRLAGELAAEGYRFPVIVHPAAVIAESAVLGAGSFVAAAAVVGAQARIGEQAIVNTGAVVEHDCDVADGVHIGPRVCLGGGVRVGRAAWIGIGAVLRDHIEIGADSMVGMGAVVVASLPSRVVAYGCPARVISEVKV